MGKNKERKPSDNNGLVVGAVHMTRKIGDDNDKLERAAKMRELLEQVRAKKPGKFEGMLKKEMDKEGNKKVSVISPVQQMPQETTKVNANLVYTMMNDPNLKRCAKCRAIIPDGEYCAACTKELAEKGED